MSRERRDKGKRYDAETAKKGYDAEIEKKRQDA
jgi:hypothetical protein